MAHYDDLILHGGSATNAKVTPTSLTDKAFFPNGRRKTLLRRSNKLRLISLVYSPRLLEELEDVTRVWEAVNGAEDTFLLVDPTDWNTTQKTLRFELAAADITKDDQPCQNTTDDTFVGDGSTTVFQTVKQYSEGSATNTRTITKLKSGILVAVNGVLQTITTHYTVDLSTGLITFVTPPPVSQTVTWGGEFYVSVAFEDDDALEHFRADFQVGRVSNLKLTEVTGV
jgi:uncharacterized protein (TIGR02217 family)